jgi:hypothetical protein
MDETAPTREELVHARNELQQQLDIVRNPMRASDRNRPLEAKLSAMIAEIDECLAGMEESDAQEAQGRDAP